MDGPPRKEAGMRRILGLAVAVMAVGLVGVSAAVASSHAPSTNDANRANDWAHVNQLSQDIGETTLEFVSARNFYSCFEYRTDGDTSQKVDDTNPNPEVTDGEYPSVCVNNTTTTRTIEADEYVEVRMVFGAEKDERFDWTRFEVIPDAQTKTDCKKGGYADYDFKNQGQCVRFVKTGKDSR
jgi:hypothetical protein